MKNNVLDTLIKRGYIAQTTDEEGLRKQLEEKTTFYLGIDPTADSLHVGHLCVLMVLKHMQDAGHRPIILVGGATGKIGDPSDRTDMRKVMTEEMITKNVNAIKEQVKRFVSFEGENAAIIVDNADWTFKENYVEFLRDVGIHFNVNKMLSAECYKSRLESGLTFFEMGYMLLQANDFKHLYENYNCTVQIGGNDQWSNLISGVDLIRKSLKKEAYTAGVTLLTKADGKKMGKTAGGALWLDANKKKPFEFYQYFLNIADEDVIKTMKLLTFIPLEEIERLEKEIENPNELKKILAYEVTKIVHGEKLAKEAEEATKASFGQGGDVSGLPEVKANVGDNIIDIAVEAGFGTSKGQIKNLIKQNGITLNDQNVEIGQELQEEDFENGYALLRKGKKKVIKISK